MQSVFTQLILHYIDLIRQFFQAASGRRAQIHALEVPHVFFAFLDELLPRNESLVTEKNIEHYTFRSKRKRIKNGFCKHVIKQTVLMGCTRGSLVETLPSLPRDLPSFVELLLLIGAGTRGVPGGCRTTPTSSCFQRLSRSSRSQGSKWFRALGYPVPALRASRSLESYWGPREGKW